MARGAYVLLEASSGSPEVILLATGSEVQLAVAARETLEAQGVPTRVVSAPCLEWFAEQDEEYRAAVLPPQVKARVSVEAGLALHVLHEKPYAGELGYGGTGPAGTLVDEFALPPCWTGWTGWRGPGMTCWNAPVCPTGRSPR